jgi:hypothetical protein
LFPQAEPACGGIHPLPLLGLFAAALLCHIISLVVLAEQSTMPGETHNKKICTLVHVHTSAKRLCECRHGYICIQI